jgi:chitin synthase
MKINIKHQKYIILMSIGAINAILISTSLIYSDKWYAFIVFLAFASLINAVSVVLILLFKIFKRVVTPQRETMKRYIYVIPCYNENHKELTLMFNSLVNQQVRVDDLRSFLIVCDGCVTGRGNESSTDRILLNILNNGSNPILVAYTTWDGKTNQLELYLGTYKDIPYILIIKRINYGKRDSLVLARQLCLKYNQFTDLTNNTDELYANTASYFDEIYYNDAIDYIIGIDADTIFDYNCTYELIRAIDNADDATKGCVGYVDILPSCRPWSLMVLYQYAEYHVAQSLRRYTQSNITGKVSCLSGCVQLLKICKETCGSEILEKFNYLPKEGDNIFNHIRSFASEDRNHVCLMLSMYPYVKTIQSTTAIAYTEVPTTLSVFMSQRRRWSLGATTNDMLLAYLPGINIFERVSAIVNCVNYVLVPFICVSTVVLIKTFIVAPTYLMLMLSIIIFIPIGYNLLIPIFNNFIFSQSMYFYLSYCAYILFAVPVNVAIFLNAIFNMDIIKWGKTRAVERSIALDFNFVPEVNVNVNVKDKVEHIRVGELEKIIIFRTELSQEGMTTEC